MSVLVSDGIVKFRFVTMMIPVASTLPGPSIPAGWANVFMGGVSEGAGDYNELGSGRSRRGRLDVGTRLKGEAMTGYGLGGE